jgi:hypothetical protein
MANPSPSPTPTWLEVHGRIETAAGHQPADAVNFFTHRKQQVAVPLFLGFWASGLSRRSVADGSRIAGVVGANRKVHLIRAWAAAH